MESCWECFVSFFVLQVLSAVPQTSWDQTQFHLLAACLLTAHPELQICNPSLLLSNRTSALWAKENAASQAEIQYNNQRWCLGSQQNIVRTGSLILLRLWSKAKICELGEYRPEGCDVKREEKIVKSLVQICIPIPRHSSRLLALREISRTHEFRLAICLR